MKKFLLLLAMLLFAANAFAGNPIIDAVNYTPTPAIPGQYFDLYIHLKNNSKFVSENVMFELGLKGGTERDSDYPFSLGEGVSKEKTIGTINPYKSVLIEYRIRVDPTALDGNYALVFKFGEGGLQKEHKYTVRVFSMKPDIEIIKASEMQASPGQVVELNLTIRNIGSGIAKDILVGLEGERTVTTTGVVVEREYSALGASFAFVPGLGANEETTARISLAINPEAEQKTYMVPIKIKYKDANAASYSKTTYIGLKVSQEPELDAVVSEVSPLAFPGGTSEATVDLFNIGVGTAKYVVADVSTESGKIEQEKVFIGTLEADDFDSFKLNLQVDPTADPSKEHTLNLTLSYKNQYGEQRTVQKALQLKVHSAAEVQAMAGGASPMLMLLGIFMLAMQLLGLYVFFYRWVYKKFIRKGK